MGIRVSTASPVIPEGLGSVIHEQEGTNVYGHQTGGSLYTQRGGKSVNQDSAVICQGYGVDGVLCGVFDGHGKYGHFVSRIVRQRLPVVLLDQKHAVTKVDVEADKTSAENNGTYSDDDSSLDINLHEWQEACVEAFEEMDRELKLVRKLDSSFSGSTAVVVVKQDKDLVIANLGDSRAILGTKSEKGVTAVQLTEDLKPGSPGEADRIIRSRGRVFALAEEPGVQRAWLPQIRCPGIAMSRSFGDFVMKKHGLIATPVVTRHHITSEDLFVVLATDGVWDVLSNDEVAKIVCGVESEEMAAKAVVNAAVHAWRTRAPLARPDDCTAVCLFLQNKDQPLSATT